MTGRSAPDDPVRMEQLLLAAEARAIACLDSEKRILRNPDVPRQFASDRAMAAERELERRRCRAALLPLHVSTDTGWAILLDLFLADQNAESIRTAQCGARWGVSDATAMRHIAALIEAGLIVRSRAQGEQGLGSAGLSDFGRKVMSQILDMCI